MHFQTIIMTTFVQEAPCWTSGCQRNARWLGEQTAPGSRFDAWTSWLDPWQEQMLSIPDALYWCSIYLLGEWVPRRFCCQLSGCSPKSLKYLFKAQSGLRFTGIPIIIDYSCYSWPTSSCASSPHRIIAEHGKKTRAQSEFEDLNEEAAREFLTVPSVTLEAFAKHQQHPTMAAVFEEKTHLACPRNLLKHLQMGSQLNPKSTKSWVVITLVCGISGGDLPEIQLWLWSRVYIK